MSILVLASSRLVLADQAEPLKQSYFTVLPDVPLMPLMTELEEHSFSFDKAEGRVVEAVGFLSASTPKDAVDFYSDTLKSLGWKATNINTFRRNNENIVITTKRVSRGLRVKLRLFPQQPLLSR